ncbi:hypothetical protein JW835_06910 [bacterium]|nr:hypothetical protein [bacterium]
MNQSDHDYFVDYIDRLQVYRQEETNTHFLQLHSYKMDLGEIADFCIFEKQVKNEIPDSVRYILKSGPSPEIATSDSEKQSYGDLLNEIQIQIMFKNRGKHNMIDLNSINLKTHAYYLLNKIQIHAGQNRINPVSQEIRLVNLKMNSVIDKSDKTGIFSFNPSRQKTFRFDEKPIPKDNSLICWQGGTVQGMIPIVISKRILNIFKEAIQQHHPKEIGGQLAGHLIKFRHRKALIVTDLYFFNSIGNETSLMISAEEYIRTAQLIENENKIIAGWIHSHALGQNSLYCSSVDISNHYQKYTMPYAVMMIADGSQLTKSIESVGCAQCPYRAQCTLPETLKKNLIPGWTLYTWTPNGFLMPAHAHVFE